MAGPSPIMPSSAAATPTPSPTTTPVPVVPTNPGAPPANGGSGGGGSGGGGNPAPLGHSAGFTIDVFAYPGSPGLAQTFSYSVPAGTMLTLLSVTFTDQHTDSGTLQVRTDTTPVATFNLADLRSLDHQFANRPAVAGGHLVTLAVMCANTASPCALTAAFAAVAGS
jgi:hypothetical protein